MRRLPRPAELPLALLALLLALPLPASADYNVDPMARWRAQIEDARRKTIPPPPKGVRDLHWNELSPPGWNPGLILERLGVRKMSDGQPGARAVEAEIQREWDQAPPVPVDGMVTVRMTGYPIMLTPGDGLVRTILLVPYMGACIHKPSPPANQMVMVSFKPGLPRNLDTSALWITGKLHNLPSSTPYGRVAYTMTDASWQRYPVERYPLPQYIPLR